MILVMKMMFRIFLLDELAVADISQESLPDVRPMDSSSIDIEEKQVDEVHDEGELWNTGVVGNESHAELYEGCCQSSIEPVVEKDALDFRDYATSEGV